MFVLKILFLQMNTMAMGAAGISTIIAVGAAAYALSLEGRILALASTQSSLSTEQTAICTAVKSFTSLTRTAATGGVDTVGQATSDTAGQNSVEGRNLDFITSFIAVGAPTCS